MALVLIARSVFAVFALFAFRYLLSRVKRTLESLTGKSRFIIQDQIGDLNESELSLPSHDVIPDHRTQMIESTQLVDSLFRSDMYNYCCMNGCDDQLQELNRSLERLLDNMQLQQARNVKEILKLSRQNGHDDSETKGLVNKLEQSAWETPNAAGDSSASTSSRSASELGEYINTELVASLEAQVEAILKVLTDVAIAVKDKTLLLRPILEHLKSTLNCIKLLLTDIVENSSKVLDIPTKELEDFGNQIKNGMELVQKCSTVDHWTSNEKHKYTNQLFKWDDSLQRQLGQLMFQVARNVKDIPILLRNVQEEIERIDRSGLVKNELKLALEVEERIEGNDVAVNELELDVVEESIEGSGMEKDEFELVVANERIERSCVTKDEFELDVPEERIEGNGLTKHELQLDVGEERIERPSGVEKNKHELHVTEERIEGSSVARIELDLDIAKEKIEGSSVTKNELELDVGEEKIEESGAAKNEVELDVVEERIEGNGLTKNEFELDIRDEGIEGSGAAKNGLELDVVEERIEGNSLTKNEFKLDVRDEGIEGSDAEKNEVELDVVEERIEGNGLTKNEFELDIRDEGIEGSGLAKNELELDVAEERIEGNGLTKNEFELDVRDEGVERSGVAKNELELDVVEEFEGNSLTKNDFELDVRDEGIEGSGAAKNELELEAKEERIEGGGVAKNEFESNVAEETIQGNGKNILELDVTEEKIERSVVAKNEFQLNVAEKRIEGSGVAKNELALNVVEVQGTRDVRETLIHEELCPVYECSMVIKYEPISSSLEVLGHKTRKTEYSKRKSLKDVGSLIFKRVFWRPSSDRYAHTGSDVVGKVQGLLWYKDIGQYMNGDFSMAVVQANNLLEDQSQLESGPLSFLESGPYGTFLGVYDGHGGHDTSRYISDHLFQHLKRFASEQQSMSVDIIRKSYKATEEGFFSIVTKQWSVKPEIAAVGSCCLTGVICGGTLYIANVGDSRAVLGRGVHGKVLAIQLSEDHNVAIESVRQEMHSLHPDDPHIVVLKHNVWRVKGLIRISRSIGDAYLKKPEFSGEPLNRKFCIRESFTRPILSAEPAISVHELQVHDQFLIFASDGLWEYLNNQEAVDIVQTHPHSGSARRLVETALRKAAKRRDMTYSYLKKIGRGVRRHFHDDITVIVIYLDSNLVSRASSITDPILSVRGGGVR